MSNASDPTQMGGVPGNRPASATRVPTPDGKAIIRSAGNALNAKYRVDHKPRPPQPLPDRQNWRKRLSAPVTFDMSDDAYALSLAGPLAPLDESAEDDIVRIITFSYLGGAARGRRPAGERHAGHFRDRRRPEDR
jgi:hypothetical protein